jgi:lipopolysaccharide cholinephosphotransferase
MEIKAKLPPEFFREEAKAIVVSAETKRLWAVLLDLLLEFDRVCRKNGIKYMVDGGTLLGAVRHGGFIPWDDDIDVIMLREEYEKLNKIASREFSAPYFWQTYATDPDHGRGFARLRNSSTTYMLHSEMNGKKSLFRHNQGVLLDVFICDNIPDRVEERSPFLKRLSKLQTHSWCLRSQGHAPWSLGLLTRIPDVVRKIDYLLLSAFSGKDISQSLLKKLDIEAQRYDNEPTEYVSHLTFCATEGNRFCYIFQRKFFEDLTEVEFEGHKLPATSHWDEYLTGFYGNWRRHVVGAGGSGKVFIDLDKPYTEYLK